MHASIQNRIQLISMSYYKGRTIIFLEGVYEKCSSANTFF